MHVIPLRGKARRKIRVGKDYPGSPGGNANLGGVPTGQNTAPYIDFYTQNSVDIDDKVANRYLVQKNGDFFSVPHSEFNLKQSGTAAVVTTNSGMVLRAPKDLIIRDVGIIAGLAPAGSAITVDIKVVPNPTSASGTSIFAGGVAGTPTLAVGSDWNFYNGATAAIFNPSAARLGVTATTTTSGSAAYGSAFFWAAGSFLRVEIPTVGSAPTGNNISVRIGAGIPWQDSVQQWEAGEGAFVDPSPPPTSNPYFYR